MSKRLLAVISVLLTNVSLLVQGQSLCQAECTFVLKSETTGDYHIVNQVRSEQRMTPWSTFKIPNSLIALDTGVVENPHQKLSFDRKQYPIQDWWRKIWYESPIPLIQAYQYSAVPIYQSLATKIGSQRMIQYLADLQYGNQDIGSGIDNFWLNGSLKISAKEQVDFLQRLYKSKLPISAKSLQSLKDIMLVETTDNYKLYAKTGAGGIAPDKALGWYVGFVENDKGVHYFALNIDAPSFQQVIKKRTEAARQQLRLAGIL